MKCASCSAGCEVCQRLQFVEGLRFLRPRSEMQVDTFKELVLQGNASTETNA